MAYLGLMIDRLIEAPTKEEMDDEEYELELREGSYADTGRSETTGY